MEVYFLELITHLPRTAALYKKRFEPMRRRENRPYLISMCERISDYALPPDICTADTGKALGTKEHLVREHLVRNVLR